MKNATRQNSAGFTLAEAAISIVIVGLMVVSSVRAVGMLAIMQRGQAERAQASALAQQLLTEVMQCYFQDPAAGAAALGPDSGETSRAAFNDVDDYNNWQGSPPTLKDGTVLGEYSGWTQSVTVQYVQPGNPGVVSGSATSLKRITVTVTAPSRKTVTLVGLRSQWGAYEKLPLQTTNYLTFTGVQVKVGATGKTVYSAAHPLNITASQ